MNDSADSDMSLEELTELVRQELFKAYESGAEEGWRRGYLEGITNGARASEADIAQAHREGGEEERKLILKWIDTHSQRYHSASEAAKFAKKFRQFVDSRPRFDA